MPRRLAWTHLSDEDLLKLRLKDLKVEIKGTWLEDCVAEVKQELAERGVRIRPHVWLSDEWFSPDNTPGIAIPFYLAHPRLMRLERKMILDVEGGTEQECRRILRHEVGHVVQHAYRLQRRRRWVDIFGSSATRYPRSYRPNPASKNFVQHLPLWYAQAHPDEDFAETFAVWLAPRSDWRNRYADWPALKKLEYVDALMEEVAGQKALLKRRVKVDPISTMTQTLGEHYERKRANYLSAAPKTYDKDLLRIFAQDEGKNRRSPTAAAFLTRNRAKMRPLVAQWTEEHQLTLDAILDDMIARCRELKLRAVGPEAKLRTEFTVLWTAQTVHLHYSESRRRWFAL
jgi:hypothetical protein